MIPAGGPDPRAVGTEWTIEDSCLLDLLRRSMREEEQSAPTYRLPIPLSRVRRFLTWGEMAAALAASEARAAAAEARAKKARAEALEEAARIAESDTGKHANGNWDFGPNVPPRIAGHIRAAARALQPEPRS